MSNQIDLFADDDFGAPLTKREQMAERITSLAVLFMGASSPLTLTQVMSALYSHLSQSAAEKAFKRDRDYLEQCGISITSVRDENLGDVYVLDENITFANASSLTHEDATIIQSVCTPYLEQPGFPYQEDLRMALAKISQAFNQDTKFVMSSTSDVSAATVQTSLMSSILHDCFAKRLACQISYCNAAGRPSTRKIAPFGLFSSRGMSYFVAAPMLSGGPNLKDIRIFREDRLKDIVPLSIRYEIPSNFSVKNYIRLPFQYGDTLVNAQLFVPNEAEQEALAEQLRGSYSNFNQQSHTITLSFNPNYVHEAARWVIAHGFRPKDPALLIEAYIDLLKGAAHHDK
ncbi:helix-turn-helix transcriptional regulator [Atopobium fossor]|uniref:helix-turn-helix transcriptional regulator n=1 Tax=Atopobium fossor TaxID=39487 RepID=UPI0004825B0C|nr:WYL domain-containing protein [Atopobium fossor]